MSVCISCKNVALQRVGVLKTIDIDKTDAWKKMFVLSLLYFKVDDYKI